MAVPSPRFGDPVDVRTIWAGGRDSRARWSPGYRFARRERGGDVIVYGRFLGTLVRLRFPQAAVRRRSTR